MTASASHPQPATAAATALQVLACPLHGRQLIEASAGTGKTWAICALYLRLLLEQNRSVGQVLVVTFTNAATAELRERIRARLAEALARLRADPGHDGSGTGGDPLVPGLLAQLQRQGRSRAELASRLDLALQSFDDAAIFTIHGFCQRALGDAAFSAQMPLQLDLLADDSDLRQAVVNDFWRQVVAVAGGAALPPALVDHLIARGDSPTRWAALLQRQLGKPTARVVWPAALDATALPLDTAALQQAWAAAATLWAAEREAIVQTLMAALPRLNATSVKADFVAAGALDWDGLLADGVPLAPLLPLPKKALLFGAGLLADKAKKGQSPPSHPFFDAAQHLADVQATLLHELAIARLRLLRRLLSEAPAALLQAKRQRRVVAFDDMLANLHQRLRSDDGPPLAATLRQRFPVALIDEFQDTDPLQFAIFDTIYPVGPAADSAPLFFVGDPKQAIYSFRNADLPTYLAARNTTHARYTLADNQRSVAPLISGLNALFGCQANPFMQPGLDYVPVQPGAKPRPALHDRSGGDTAALQLWQLPLGDDGQPLPKRLAQQQLVLATAAEIARLLRAGRAGAITLAERALQAGDIAVLVRNHRQGSLLRQALAALGVGSVELSRAGIFHSPDAQDLEHLLAAVLEPTRVPLLKAALATPLLGLDAAAVLALGDDELALQQRMQRLADWRALWLQRGVAALLRRLMADEAVAQRLLQRPDGERRLTNLLHLSELLHQAAQQHGAPEALLRWLQAQRQDSRSDDASQLRLESDRNLVQIVTIHKSKGLEYGLVFCPFLWDGRSSLRRSELDGTVWHDGASTVIDFRLPGADGLDAAAVADIALRQKRDTAAEDLRLAYVALTRAVQRCVLVAGPYRAAVGRSLSTAESCRSLLNWLVAGAGHTPEAWLTAKPPPCDMAQIDTAWAALLAAANQGSATAADAAQLPLLPDVMQTAGAPADTVAAMSSRPLPLGAGLALPPLPLAADALAALAPPRHIPAAWRIGSYSALVHGAVHEQAAQDHDRRQLAGNDDDGNPAFEQTAPGIPAASATPTAPVSPAPDDDDILNFPRGPAAGDALHAVFEAVDFSAPAGWPAAVASTLRAHAAALPGAGDALAQARHQHQLLRLLADVLATPLTPAAGAAAPSSADTVPPLQLAQVPLTRRLTELEFHLAADQVGADALNALLARHGYPSPRLSGAGLRGYLKGFIDLVVQHGERWYVIDWKSNHLGPHPTDYGPAPLADAMAREGYHLQHLLYSLALQRWLARRLPGFDAARHFGGVLYLFVRGVRPGWRNPDGTPCGVFFHQPGTAVMAALSALLAGQAPRP